MFCPHCGNEVQEGTVFCPKCGTRLRPATDAVTGSQSVAGQTENNSAQPRPEGGAQGGGYTAPGAPAGGSGTGQGYTYSPNPNYNPAQQQKKSSRSKVAAGLLGIFLGGWGAHNFYLGKTSRAVAQIVVTIVTCGIGSIWGLIEGIMCLCGNYTDVDGLPLSD